MKHKVVAIILTDAVHAQNISPDEINIVVEMNDFMYETGTKNIYIAPSPRGITTIIVNGVAILATEHELLCREH